MEPEGLLTFSQEPATNPQINLVYLIPPDLISKIQFNIIPYLLTFTPTGIAPARFPKKNRVH
jgi:hypothetical protein